VQALHAGPRATDSPARLDQVGTKRCGPAALGVVIVSSLEFIGVDEGLKAVDPTVTFESTHGAVQLRIDKPKQSGHGRAVAQVRFVLDHRGSTVPRPHDYRETPIQWAAD
jgi:hypothetical protein